MIKCSVFIATSLDGFIAKNDGNIDWLHTSGNSEIDMGELSDMKFNDYLASVDCMIIGRKTMDVISNMNLDADQWPYGNKRIVVLSNSLKVAPENMKHNVEMYSGDIRELLSSLEEEGHKHAYIDGGTTIQTFIRLQLISEITITIAPIILGEGKSLFGKIKNDIKLEQTSVKAYPNDFVQINYTLNYL